LNLEKVYSYLREKYQSQILIHILEGYPDYNDGKHNDYHQAGFDAYVTGASFIYMFEELGMDTMLSLGNKIYIMRSIYACINLDGPEPYFCPNVLFIIIFRDLLIVLRLIRTSMTLT
jgi:hypothetical protein